MYSSKELLCIILTLLKKKAKSALLNLNLCDVNEQELNSTTQTGRKIKNDRNRIRSCNKTCRAYSGIEKKMIFDRI